MKNQSIAFRFIFRHLASRFAISFCFSFLIFVLFDYALLQVKSFNSALIQHYIAIFFYRYELFAIISAIFATASSLYSLARNNELVALQVAGLSLTTCIRPFVFFGLLLSLLGYTINEFGIPATYKWIRKKHFRVSTISKTPFVHEFLNDGSHIVYQLTKGEIFDFYWIRSSDDIWHANTITDDPTALIGHYVDHLEKTADGKFVKTASYDTYYFPTLLSNLEESVNLKPVMSLTSYFKLLFTTAQMNSKDHAPILTRFFHKLTNPLFPFITILLSYLLFFTFSFRNKPIWLSFASALLFLGFFSLSKTFIILSENYMLAPWLPFIVLPLMVVTYSSWRIVKLSQ